VPSALKLQEKYGDALAVIFVECQGASRDQYEAFAWKSKWMGGPSLWTEERPFATIGNGLPETALLGVDGTILLQGYPGDFGKKLEEHIEAEIKKGKDAPADAPAGLRPAWKLYRKGEIAAAIAECDKIGGDEAAAARAEFVKGTTQRVARAEWLLDNGYVAEAEKLVSDLAKGTQGVADLESAVAKKKPFEPANVKKAAALADKFAGTKTAERARRFADLAAVKLSS